MKKIAQFLKDINNGEKGQGGIIQFLVGAIVVAILLYILLVIIKTLFFQSA
jgi:hypothetical protein